MESIKRCPKDTQKYNNDKKPGSMTPSQDHCSSMSESKGTGINKMADENSKFHL